MAEETTFYSDQQGVRVTDKRVIFRTTTYALANITSVSTDRTAPSYAGPLLLFLIAAVALFVRGGGILLAIVSAVLGVFWWRKLRPTWHLHIKSASGESSPIQSGDEKRIASIAQAINEAIIHRG
ncbi:MAG TPA: DUF6232 family protein [Methylomirabilota bacterium]|jgi:hypothetical protein|nr:DUF6232 family protein [Methylomirabilota bacterium]